MKKESSFKLRSGNKPSVAKLAGVNFDFGVSRGSKIYDSDRSSYNRLYERKHDSNPESSFFETPGMTGKKRSKVTTDYNFNLSKDFTKRKFPSVSFEGNLGAKFTRGDKSQSETFKRSKKFANEYRGLFTDKEMKGFKSTKTMNPNVTNIFAGGKVTGRNKPTSYQGSKLEGSLEGGLNIQTTQDFLKSKGDAGIKTRFYDVEGTRSSTGDIISGILPTYARNNKGVAQQSTFISARGNTAGTRIKKGKTQEVYNVGDIARGFQLEKYGKPLGETIDFNVKGVKESSRPLDIKTYKEKKKSTKFKPYINLGGKFTTEVNTGNFRRGFNAPKITFGADYGTRYSPDRGFTAFTGFESGKGNFKTNIGYGTQKGVFGGLSLNIGGNRKRR